jgi:stage III sporulation protein AA
LPPPRAAQILACAALCGGGTEEGRLYRGGQAIIVSGAQTYRVGVTVSGEEMDAAVRGLCGGSLYAHADTIREGYLCTAQGIRVGVCGRAVCRDGRITAVEEITSLCIRVPRTMPRAADGILPLLFGEGSLRSILIWSPPGVGKTTALRALALRLGEKEPPLRVAVIDTRFELCDPAGTSVDYYCGYPRDAGIAMAVRTMSPDILLCDEIAGEADARAIADAHAAGTAVAATAHAGSREDLLERPALRTLWDARVFSVLVGLRRVEGTVRAEPVFFEEGAS